MMKAVLLVVVLLSTLASAQLKLVTFSNVATSGCQTAPGCKLSDIVDSTILSALTTLLPGVAATFNLDFASAGTGLYITVDQSITVNNLGATGGNTITVLSGITATTTNFTVAASSAAYVQGTVAIQAAAGAAASSTTFLIDSSSALYVTASGSINAAATNVVASGQANVAGSITTTGSYSQNAGNLILNSTSTTASSAVVAASAININAGASLSGNGNLGTAGAATTLSTSGSINIGNSPGTVTVNGDWRPSSTSTFNLEIASQSSFDQLIVSGKAYPNGFLRVTLLNNYVPGDNTRFSFISAAGGTQGSFSSTTGTSASTLTKWTSSVSSNNVIANYNSAVSVAVSGFVLIAVVLASLL